MLPKWQQSGSIARVDSKSFEYRGRTWTIFRRGETWTIRLTVGGRRKWIALDTAEASAAIRRAKVKIDELQSGKLAKDIEERPVGRVPTFAEVAAIYKAAKVVRETTARNNLSTLFLIVRRMTGITDVAGLRIDVLSAELATAWLAKRQGLPSPDRGTLRAENASANASLKQAATVFARRHRAIYAGWRLPAGVDAFCGVKALPEPSHRYVPLPGAILAAIDAAADKLGESDLELWIVNRSIRLMGLRASEVAAMKTTWLVDRDGRLSLDVRARPGEFVPKGHEGSVTVPSVLATIFRQRMKDGPAHLVRIPPRVAANGGKLRGRPTTTDDETRRHHLIYHRHSQWLREFIGPDRKKTNHELRKEAGSRVAKKLNSWEAAARFLREDLETAKKHYLELLEPVGLEEEDL